MNRRQKIIVSITGIFIVMLALVGLTYAYFLTRITGNENEKSISVTTANLELVYGDGNNLVRASNIEPGDPITPKTFTVTNNGNATIEDFNIYLENVINQFSRKTDLIYTITCENITVGATSTECEEFEVVENEVNGTELIFPSVMSVIARDTLDPATEDTNAEVHEYTITLTYKEMNVDQSEDMNKKVEAKVNIYDNRTKFLASELMINARKTGTFDYNKTEYIDPSLQDGITYTIPAEQINKENERIITYTFDDYGTSYYFRGNAEDNYVTFSNKCWRIVRIQGDGSIKLILESQSPCSESMTGDFSIGYDYWDEDQSAAIIKNILTTWLNATNDAGERTNITAIAEKWIKTEEWCLGNTTNTYSYTAPYGLLGTTASENYLSGTGFYYETGRNLYGYGVKPNATLKCNGETDSLKLGALTADEVVFAGGKAGTPNFNLYLKGSWWTFSRSSFNGNEFDYVFAFRLNHDGSLIDLTGIPDSSSVRPAVTLKSGIVISGGNGTIKEPYVIE